MKRIVLTGGECTGKTTLCEFLSVEFGTSFAPEYSRAYAVEKGSPLTLDDVMPIASGQVLAEQKAGLRAKGIVFYDSNPLASMVYSKWYYDAVPKGLHDIIAGRKYDLYLLCYPDIKWQADGVRDQPEKRLEIFKLFEQELKNTGANYRVVRGIGTARCDCAVKYIKEFIANGA